MDWDDKTSKWTVRTDIGDEIRSTFTVTANGIQHKLKLPGVPGIDSSKGKPLGLRHHRRRFNRELNQVSRQGYWDDRHRSNGRPTSPSTRPLFQESLRLQTNTLLYQPPQQPPHLLLPQITLLSQTRLATPPPGQLQYYSWWRAEEEDLGSDGWTNTATQAILSAGSKDIDPAKLGEMMALADFKLMDRIRARVDEIVKDPTTAEKLKPWHSSMCKRPCFHDEYLQAFNQDNVSLIDTNAKGVERIC
jgi:cyclohexanone monooxygenase